MRRFRWIFAPVALFWLTGYDARSLDECLAQTTVDCAIEQAIAVADTIADDHQRAGAFAYIARVQADIGREADARWMVDRVLFLKRDMMDSSAHDGLAANLARIYALLGDFATATDTAAGIGDPSRMTMAYTWISQSQARAGDKAGADRSIALALAGAKDLDRGQLSSYLAQMAIAQAYIGNKAETLAIVDSAVKLSDRFDSDMMQARVATIAAVALNLAGERDLSKKSLVRAEALLAAMNAANAPAKERASVLAYLAWAQALTGDRGGALATTEPLKTLIGDGLGTFSQSSQLAAIALVLVKAE